ncbi:haloacid dehalogenase-like hydrolase, partial [Streptococcus suis]
GYKVAVVSGGFHETVDRQAVKLELDYFRANRLEAVDGVLTGQVFGEIVTKDTKKACLEELETENVLSLSQTIAMGYGE